MSSLERVGGWPAVLQTLLGGRDLSVDAATAAMDTILAGGATDAQIAAFLVALRAKGETADELAGMLASTMAAASLVPLDDDERDAAIDVVGTGGDGSHTVNVSTMAALVVAAAGVPVCKHGNRSASSKCGTADVLEQLGVAIELSSEAVATCVREVGIGFCFAQRFHPAFRFAGPPRREIGVPTAFNLLGPLANPGGVRRQLLGVADPRFAEPMLVTLERRGLRSAWVVHGDGLDELTTAGVSTVLALRDGVRSSFEVDPAELGLAPATLDDLRGGDPNRNVEVVHAVLGGERGPYRDIVLLNAAAALVVAGRADDLPSGLRRAVTVVDDGTAAEVLAQLVATSQRLATD